MVNVLKKEAQDAKTEGRVDEKEADPISISMFRRWMVWAVESRNMFVWFMGLLQWNFMGRSISIGMLCLHNFKLRNNNNIRYQQPNVAVTLNC